MDLACVPPSAVTYQPSEEFILYQIDQRAKGKHGCGVGRPSDFASFLDSPCRQAPAEQIAKKEQYIVAAPFRPRGARAVTTVNATTSNGKDIVGIAAPALP